jgi:cell wall-associated NlpC family hydrolase
MKPDSPANPVSDLVLGSILVTGDKPSSHQEYFSVKLPDGRSGFVNGKSVMDFSLWRKHAKTDSANLVKTAIAQMGKPYLWGGTSAKGFDCSGFTKTVYQANGTILARDASQQVNQGTEVPRISIWNEIITGDLLFFGRKATGEQSERVSHVGMYIGNSEFIHCSGLVRINSLDSTHTNFKPYYLTNLLHVKRMTGGDNTPGSFINHPWY